MWRSREEILKQQYSVRITQLTQQLQFTESKAAAYSAECRALRARLDVWCVVLLGHLDQFQAIEYQKSSSQDEIEVR
jgi:hypothetical protein